MMKKRLMIALCCLVLLVQLLPVVPLAETTGAETVDKGTVSQDLYYCRAQLGDLPNGEALLHAYDNIVAGIDAYAEVIEISNDKYKLTLDEFKLALEAVRRDHTEQFWLHRLYTYKTDAEGYVIGMNPQYLWEKEDLPNAKVAFEQAIDSFLAELTPDMDEYEMEKALHDRLATKVTYVSTNNAHNAYGALVEGKAVCEGYAEALQCLLQRVGIQSIQVYGQSINPSTGTGENHAWNIVRIDGKYYLTDLTWNDQDTMLLYAYFNQTHAVFNEDHQQWRVGNEVQKDGSIRQLQCEVFDLPVCTATEANYFIKTAPDSIIDNYTVESIAQILKENDLSVRIFVKSDVNAFMDWFFKKEGKDPVTILAIAEELGITGSFTPNAIQMGREVYIYFDTCLHEQLTLVAAKSPTCDKEGNSEYYICQGKDCGKWFLDASADTEIVNRDSVKLLPAGHDFTVKTESEATLSKKAEKCTEHDTYFLTCSVCDKVSDTYTFETDAIGEHAYSETWEKDDVTNHKRVCANGCGIDITEAHDKNGEDSACSVCGYKFSIKDVISDTIPDIDAGEVADDVISTILSNPLILLGGGGSVALVVIIVIIKKIREG